MDTIVWDDIPFQVDFGELTKSLNMSEDHPFAERLVDLATEAEELARPKGLYGVAFVDSKEDNAVVLDGIRFTSRILRVNLDQVERVFPFVATCGRELDAWSQSIEEMFARFCADAIKEQALYAAIEALGQRIAAAWQPGATSMMNPGSLDDWPTEEQGNLFRLIGDASDKIGVELTKSFVMHPIKSVSGIWFSSQEGFQSCMLCPRENCPKRRAPYDRDLHETKYKQDGGQSNQEHGAPRQTQTSDWDPIE